MAKGSGGVGAGASVSGAATVTAPVIAAPQGKSEGEIVRELRAEFGGFAGDASAAVMWTDRGISVDWKDPRSGRMGSFSVDPAAYKSAKEIKAAVVADVTAGAKATKKNRRYFGDES